MVVFDVGDGVGWELVVDLFCLRLYEVEDD